MSTHYLKLTKKTAVLTCHVPNRTCMPALPRHYISITFNYMQIHCQFTLCLNFLRSTNAKNRTDITANTAPTNPIYDIAPLSHTIPPIQLPPPIPRLKSPEYMADLRLGSYIKRHGRDSPECTENDHSCQAL